jgi:UDP-N-acetylmuramate--alanine ligase
MKLSDIKKVHFIGVGGIGMSGLARLFLYEGKEVSGSDRVPSDITHALQNEGVRFFETQVKENIETGVDLVIYTEALPKDHEEILEANAKGIPTINYFEGLGMVANEYYLIAVAGSHGKTTTTAMLIDVFEEAAGLDPSAIVGSLRSKTKSNYRAGKSKYFIVEACEYRRDFLSLEPDILVITNIEHEHVDYYKDLEAVQKAFRELAVKVSEDGFIVANLSDPNVLPVVEGLSCTVIDYRKYVDPLRKLTMPGMHNQMNAGAVTAVATHLGVKPLNIDEALGKFGGTWRRFEYKGECNGAKVYDDYGHHPTEIKATMQGARELYPDRHITIVFQSHTFTRTHELFSDFVDVLALADCVIVLPIYFAREENVSGVSHTKLADAIREKNKNILALDTVEEAVTELKKSLSSKDVVITMGAGDMTSSVADGLVS